MLISSNIKLLIIHCSDTDNDIDIRAGNPNIYDKMIKKLDNF